MDKLQFPVCPDSLRLSGYRESCGFLQQVENIGVSEHELKDLARSPCLPCGEVSIEKLGLFIEVLSQNLEHKVFVF